MLLETKKISNQLLVVLLLMLIMIALTEEPLPCWKNPKKERKFKCKSWIKKLINCCFSQNITKHKLTAYLMYLCYFFSYLSKYLNRYWVNQLDIFITTSTKTAILIAKHLKKHMAYNYTNKIVHPSLSKDMKGAMQIKRGKCYSLMLLCLKIRCTWEPNKRSPYHQQSKTTLIP